VSNWEKRQMLHDPKTFDIATAVPASIAKIKTPAQAAADRLERREQDRALAVMLTYVGVLVLSGWFWGIQGLVGWALTSAALAGAWVIYTTRGIRGADSD
jgi:hypothetical protein